jgi:acyl-CoA reductase-like NAD-dependent aldehyde dehydrogenase
MIPLWFLPYAVATGNCFVLKPSERVPMTTQQLVRLCEEAGFPAGVVSLVNGGKETVDALLDHPAVRAVSFVGSTPVARVRLRRATANGKRAQCQGGAKNPAIVLPDADMDMSTRILADSRLRLRRPALPRDLGRDHRRRGAGPSPSASSSRRRTATRGSASASTTACRWAR